MSKKKRSSASRNNQPPSSTAIDQPPPPPAPVVEPVDPEIKHAISRAVTAVRSGELEKALDFIKDSVSCHPLSGHLHYVEGRVHQSLADNADKDSVKHLEDGVFSAQLAVDLLPNSIHSASLLADLLYQLAIFNQEWGRVIEVCKHALKIENQTDSWAAEVFGEDVSEESRIEDEKQTIVMLLPDAERKNLEFAEKIPFEAVKIDINHVVMAMDRRKKQFKAITTVCSALKHKMIDNSKKFDCDDEEMVEYKRFCSGLSDEMKRGFQKVNIEELVNHLKSLQCQLAEDHLSEAIEFAKKKQTLKFWECYDCVEKFNDYASYRIHFWEKHWMNTVWKLASGVDIESKSDDMIVNCVWKPVDTAEATKIIVNHTKSELCSASDSELGTKKGLDECKSSNIDAKWVFCDDIERAGILVLIRGMFYLLQKNNCLASIHVRWAIEYAKDQFESTVPLSQFMIHGMETPQIICSLGASQLTELLKFLRVVVSNCGLSIGTEMDSSKDDKPSGDHFIERVDFSEDYTCLLWQELQGDPDDTDYLDAAEDDGSAIIFPIECDDAVVFSDSFDIVPWLYAGSNCGEALESWTSLRDFQRGQAMKFLKMFDEELSQVSSLCDEHIKMSSKLKAVEAVGSMIVEEIKKTEKCPEDQRQHFADLLKKRREEIQGIDDASVGTELEVISNVLEEQADSAIRIALRRLKMQLLIDLCLLDAITLRIFRALEQYEGELASISVYDYRSIIVPMMKSFLQPHLKDLLEDAKEKSKVAVETLLAEIALEEAEKKIVKDSDKKKKMKKKKKNKTANKAKDSEATEDNKHIELHQKGAEDSLDEPKQSSISDEERMLDQYLENQRRFEDEASLNVNVPSSGVTNEDVDSRE